MHPAMLRCARALLALGLACAAAGASAQGGREGELSGVKGTGGGGPLE